MVLPSADMARPHFIKNISCERPRIHAHYSLILSAPGFTSEIMLLLDNLLRMVKNY
jgi:hypothetical protein